MSPELTAALVRDFPALYAWPHGEENQFCFECSDGWEPLIRRMSARLVEACPDLRCEQLKSKFGGLRWHGFPFTDRTNEIVAEAEAESFRTCEICGGAGEPNPVAGWYWTLCASCHTEKVRERNER